MWSVLERNCLSISFRETIPIAFNGFDNQVERRLLEYKLPYQWGDYPENGRTS